VQCLFAVYYFLNSSAAASAITSMLVPFLHLMSVFKLPINVEMLSGYCHVVVMLKAQTQCATGLTDQLFESVCSNIYIVYLRLKITLSSLFFDRAFISCYTHMMSMIIFCNFGIFACHECDGWSA